MCTHTRARMHTNTHARTHACTHTYSLSLSLSHTHTHTHTLKESICFTIRTVLRMSVIINPSLADRPKRSPRSVMLVVGLSPLVYHDSSVFKSGIRAKLRCRSSEGDNAASRVFPPRGKATWVPHGPGHVGCPLLAYLSSVTTAPETWYLSLPILALA